MSTPKRKRYDYERAAKIAASNEEVCPYWRGTTVRKVLRKLVREAALKARRGIVGPPEMSDYDFCDRIAKELVP